MILLVLCVLYLSMVLQGKQPAGIQARPEAATATLSPQMEAQVRALLPPGAHLLQSLPLRGGSVALAWEASGSARTGVAAARPGDGYQLWTAATPGRADVATTASISLVQLPGMADEVLVSAYRTEGCCAWVNLFALADPPRILFASPTSNSRLLGGHVVVQKPLPGSYPDGPAADTDVYTWNGREFALAGATLAPQHYFPLPARMRWRYVSRGQVVERWVQESRRVGSDVQFRVRSILRRGSAISALPDALYAYDPEGQVRQVTPDRQVLLGASPGEGSVWDAAAGIQASVVDVKPWVTVRAGTFRDVLVVAVGSVRRYYAPHVGLIREDQGDEPALELLSYEKQ